MIDLNFKRWNTILGWFSFVVALTTYALTVEPTASFWDAGEYIATSSKLLVGHPPGAPLYQMLGAFFSIFSSDPSRIAITINLMSGVASAFTILFMFWSITILILKIAGTPEELSSSGKIAVLGSSLVGSLGFAFTDSFWFSAVEAEVYAMASCLMAVMFYVGLLWERDMLNPRGNRWLILLSLIIGLSFGVHFMGLLTIPAIGFLYYFKHYKDITIKSFLLANVAVVAILMFIFKFLLPYTLALFGKAEVFFTNSFGLPFNSGTVIIALLIIALFYFGIRYTRKNHKPQLNTLLLCVLFIFIGFSSWMMLPIRANAAVTINENDPKNARELLAYYNREQYGESHLFYGPQFTEMYGGLDQSNPYKDDKPIYEQDEESGQYVIVNEYKNTRQNLEERHKTFLPRMWSSEHNTNYLNFTGPLDISIKPEFSGEQELINQLAEFRKAYALGQIDNSDYDSFLKQYSEYLNVEKPSFWDNIGFLFEYQIGYMYWRYFMWNFVGRQNDIQGELTDLNGNWLSGIGFIDELHLGPQDNLPSDMAENKARNTYYFLPLLIGLIGFFFHLNKDVKNFWVLLVFFLFTGIALKIYLNERPFEPRERDYALVGSFYVFAIWIGIGVYALYDSLKKYASRKILAPAITVICLLAVPVLLAAQNWDDHDRSGRKTALSMAKMYLDSCDENAILFTIGDNDTFALWYAQEIEGYRTDVRVVNTMLFGTDWFIEQMRNKAYESDPLKMSVDLKNYEYGVNDAVFFQPNPRVRDTMLLTNWLKYINSDADITKGELQSGQTINTFPTKKLLLPVDKERVLKNGIVSPKDADKIVSAITLELNGNILYKHRLAMLDVVANNNWKRPIYFTGGAFGDDDYLWMKDYLQLDGVCYKLVPIETPINPRNPYEMGRIDTDKMYSIVMDWDWGNSGDPDIYHDPETRRNGISYRSNLGRLVEELVKEKDTVRAKKVLDLSMEKMPVEYFGYYSLLDDFINGYYDIGEDERAREIWEKVVTKYQEQLIYFSNMEEGDQMRFTNEILSNLEQYRSFVDLLIINQDEKIVEEKASEFNDYLSLFGLDQSDAPEDDEIFDGIPDTIIQNPDFPAEEIEFNE
ncbi:DUF2723 domain-containing protein [Gangjinia marincola]|uniref:DUF2723 domain-containing protein n=1 Tax=Gangjinia marincola TaxID=578463 RepID=A0ABN1MF50_9FLAO